MNRTAFWLEIFVPAGPGAPGLVSELLFSLGCSGIEERESGLTAWFDPGLQDSEDLLSGLQAGISRLRASGLTVGDPLQRTIKSSDWNEAWRAWFKPVQVTPTLLVRPPWEKPESSPNVDELLIMPRMAFGTGTHETTQLCIEMVERMVYPSASLLDIGTGSGILAIAAAKWQAVPVTALDIDPAAIENCLENAALNGVSGRIGFVCGTLDCIHPMPYDFVTANINTRVLGTLLHELHHYLSGGSRLILSGMLMSESGAFIQTINDNGYHVIEKHEKGEWAGIMAESIL